MPNNLLGKDKYSKVTYIEDEALYQNSFPNVDIALIIDYFDNLDKHINTGFEIDCKDNFAFAAYKAM